MQISVHYDKTTELHKHSYTNTELHIDRPPCYKFHSYVKWNSSWLLLVHNILPFLFAFYLFLLCCYYYVIPFIFLLLCYSFYILIIMLFLLYSYYHVLRTKLSPSCGFLLFFFSLFLITFFPSWPFLLFPFFF